ncbi:MAG TPA: efflux RND transporter periplasmic adaptor subunit [Gemmatimonadales bacterium]|jgi:membrane fusion protein, copper/silver efflux system|nr:efflux RND transporter periplasmic adaptor subunit [Gemmatimonadales bacterium]
MTTAPFETGPRAPGRRSLRVALPIAALVATVVVVRLLTRTPAPPATEGHDGHGVVGTDSAQAVMLSAQDRQRIGVTFATVEAGPLQREVRTVAQVTYDETRVSTVTLKVDGWVERLFVDATGQAVRRGDPLLELYSPMVVSAEREYLVARALVADVGRGTGAAQAGALDLLASARRRLLYWDVPEAELARLEQSGAVGKTVTFTAPASGVVVEKPVLAGQQVMAGEPLYKIADLSRVWLEGEVFERDLPDARLGLEVTAELPALPGARRRGRITYVYPTLNPETRTGRIRVELANPDLILKPGMYATIWFRAPTRRVLSVPRAAVLVTGERNLVFVKDTSGMLSPRQVTLGAATADRIEILSGLAAGEQVVASGTFLVDAESNLGATMGGMGDMPGMLLTSPRTGPPPPAPADTAMPDMPSMPGMKTPAPPKDGADAH